jgi:ankyrin repeat protein
MNDVNSKKLLNAIKRNDIPTASSLISNSVMNLNDDPLPLFVAARLGCVEIMTMLLDAGADIDLVDEGNRSTACHTAIWNDQFDALKLLVERGANLGINIVGCSSLLSTVAQFGRSERFAILLLDAGAPLDHVSTFNLMKLVTSIAVFNRMMARNVDIATMRDDFGRTLCHHVAQYVTCEGYLRVVLGACVHNVNGVDSQGATPLHSAVSSRNDLAVRVLVEFGADIDRQNNTNRGRSALHFAALKVQSSCVELLLALGADVNLVDRWGTTASRCAADRQRPASLCAVVAAGGDLDQPDNNGETPRMIAIRGRVALPTADEIDAARRRIAKTRLDLVRERAFQICVGLQSLRLNALQLCEIMMHSFGALGSLIMFHQWWAIAVKVKHLRDRKQQSSTTTTTSTTNNETKKQ